MATTTTTTRTSVTTAKYGGQTVYFKSLPGILRINEIILSLITFVCAVANICSTTSFAGWAAFVSFMAFLGVVTFLLLHFFGIADSYPQYHILLIELIFYATWTVFYLIAASVLASLASRNIPGCTAASGTGSFFGFCAMVLFGFDTILVFKEWYYRRTLVVQTSQIETT